jgi:hypothetical protein
VFKPIRTLLDVETRVNIDPWVRIPLPPPASIPRDSALRVVTKEAIRTHVLLTGSLFAFDIPFRLLRSISLQRSCIAAALPGAREGQLET